LTMGTSYSKVIAASCVAIAALNQGVTARPWISTTPPRAAVAFTTISFLDLRGGESSASDTTAATATDAEEQEPSLDEKVYAAMKKLGMNSPDEEQDEGDCKDGVCPMPGQETGATEQAAATTTIQLEEINPYELADTISKDMNLDSRLVMAAIGATSTFGAQNERIYNEQAARAMIQTELDLIANIPTDSPDVQELVQEGFDPFLSRRAVAFAEQNMDDARAILIADQMDEEEDQQQEDEEEAVRAQLRAEQADKKLDMVEVKSNFDPTALPTTPKPKAKPPQAQPKPAARESVIFEATTAQIQELVLESPVPVLLDVYADWCGPCKVLTPALEEMAVKSGGVFRLVKINSDNERPVSGALEVTALPTIFGVRDGKIINMFQGMPSSEKAMQNFMMGLFGAAPFSPPVTNEESEKYEELTAKLIKTAGAACFSFSARERLTERITTRMDDLVKDDSVQDVEGAATLLRTLFNNVLKDPYDQKFRKVNLENKMIASKIGNNASCLAVLKSVGFSKSGSEMVVGKDKKVINVAPLVVARDCIDKWIQKNRKEMATAARARKDEMDRVKLQAEWDAASDEEEEVEEVEVVDPTKCTLKLRLDGKKKVHEVVLHEDDPLSSVLGALEVDAGDEEFQITCVAKRLVVKSSDQQALKKTLREHGLLPSAAIVVKVGSGVQNTASSLKDRVAEKKSRKKGSHTMQSIGVYAKDDNNKAELIDGGGGTWYEHDVSSDDEEEVKEEAEEQDSAEPEAAEEDAGEEENENSGD
jgi:thioredoxin-like negative regulator of GroEL